ncbi:nicotinate/nicotinamide mononucleotide adenyltransferase isoform X2 [Wolffia australiana]
MDVPLPTSKFTFPSEPPMQIDETFYAMEGLSISDKLRDPAHVVLVSTGSFNPPTYMHLRMFELARDALKAEGFLVLGGYMSPVNDSYKKKGLVSAEHRIHMCDLACKSSSFVMVDPWEAKQTSYQRTLTVLSRIRSYICDIARMSEGSLKVMLLCGSDLLESFTIPGVWIPDQVEIICRDFGIVCIRREDKDTDELINRDEILNRHKSNIFLVDDLVPNKISSSKIRECISRGLSAKYLTADEIISYIKEKELYLRD